MRHQKVIIEASPVGIRDFADVYRFGEAAGPAPVVHYTGGQITAKEHAERFGTEPLKVVREVERALELVSIPRVDVVISSSPPSSTLPAEERPEAWVSYVFDVLFPAAGIAPALISFIGYSAGAWFATYLAASHESARALVTFGGAGVREAAREAGSVVSTSLETRLYRNSEDVVPAPQTYVGALPRAYGAIAMGPLAGAHSFEEYARNGTVAEAFSFVFERLKI